MNKKLMQAALAGLVLGSAVVSNSVNAHGAESMETESCWGVNKCKGMGNCGIGKTDIEVANLTYKGKYKKSSTQDCSGNNACSAKKGILAWVPVGKGHCLKIQGGFLIEDKAGKKVVVEK